MVNTTKSFQHYIGQQKAIEALRYYIAECKRSNKYPDHILLHGQAGGGKTTLAQVIANELNVPIRIATGATIGRGYELVYTCMGLPEGGILFIDEIHRLPKKIEEMLYTVMENGTIDVDYGGGELVRIKTPRLLIIGATTMLAKLSDPLRSRFGMTIQLEEYTLSEMTQIIKEHCTLLEMTLPKKDMIAIASRSQSNPRRALSLVRRVKEAGSVAKAFSLMGIDKQGLDSIQQKYLSVLQQSIRPLSLDSLSSRLREDSKTLSEVVEPYLLYRGYIVLTSQGRSLAEAGRQHIDKGVKL